MSDEQYDYDPGQPFEPPRRKRRSDYKRESEYDDAWAAANEAGEDFDDADIEDFAAGFHWEDRDRYGVEPDDQTAPAPDWQSAPRPAPRSESRSPRRAPTYHRDRSRRNEYAEYHGPAVAPPSRQKRQRVAEPVWHDAPRGIPYWQILALVVMAVFALLAIAFACASVLLLI